jgi:hypothetical protein
VRWSKLKKIWYNEPNPELPHEAALPDESDARIEPNSPTWRFITKWTSDEIDAARDRNDSRHRDEIDTAYIRGQIAILRDLAELPNAGRDNRPGILSHREAGKRQQ